MSTDSVSPGRVIKWGFLTIFGVAVIVIALSWIVQGNDFFMYKVFAPAREQVRREVFEETKSYNQGMIQELQNMQLQYVQADDAHKKALKSIILHRAADYPEDKMPRDLADFVHDLKRESGLSR